MPGDVNIEATREIANRVNNPFIPIYTDPDETYHKFDANQDERAKLDEVFTVAGGSYDENCNDEAVLDIFLALARIVPNLHLVAAFHDPATADFHWSKLRCLFAGAGFIHHTAIATALSRIYPMCAMRPDETIEEWRLAVKEAHRLSGWPTTISLAPWFALSRAVQAVPKDAMMCYDWMRAVSMLHLLKHLRYSKRFGLVAAYGGNAVQVEVPHDMNICGKKQVETLSVPLGLIPGRGKNAHPLTVTVLKLLREYPITFLLPRNVISDVPGYVLAGPWSTLDPDPQAMQGFVQHGMGLSNVWMAEGGRVQPVSGGTAEIVGFDWNIRAAIADNDSRARFIASLPPTYDMNASPADVFIDAFPNVALHRYGLEARAFAAVFDAVICAGLMRNECSILTRERPFLLFMPANPNPDDSTNQGKTYAADVVAAAFVPGIGRGKAVPNTNSAPDMRSLASEIEQYGTLNIDEWVMPSSPQHILCHRNLQTLLVGGQVNVGKAFENESYPIGLKYPLIANTKVFSVPPDLVNRCFPVFMETFTDEQRSRSQTLFEVESGRTSVRLRLAALGMVERLELAKLLNDGRFNTTNTGSRYQGIRAMSIAILKSRAAELSAEKATEHVDAYMSLVRAAVNAHTREAEASGLLAQQTEGEAVNVRCHSMFSELGLNRLLELIEMARHESPDNGAHGLTPNAVLRGRLHAAGVINAPNLAPILTFLGGRSRLVSDRVIQLAFSRDLRAVLPVVGDKWLLPDICGERGWWMVRAPDSGGAIRLRIEQLNVPATHRG